MSVFETLNKINVNDKTEKKNGLTYLPWAYAWGDVKKAYPDATYTIYENENGWFYFTDGKTCWVKTGVTIEGIENIEYLPVMDYRNRSIPAEAVTSFDVNKAIQRSLTKACARHGLGLYIYAGEDLPESTVDSVTNEAEKLGVKVEVFEEGDIVPKNIQNNMKRDGISIKQVKDIVAMYKLEDKTTQIKFYKQDTLLWLHQNWSKIVEYYKKEGKK